MMALILLKKLRSMFFAYSSLCLYWYFICFFCAHQNDAQTNTTSSDDIKVHAKSKPRSARQNLNGSIFTNMQHLHPTFQIFVLRRIITFYTSKKELSDDISFYHCMSVSVTFLCYFFHSIMLLCNLFFFLFQQLLTYILAVFWDLGICDLIDTFKDVQKVQHAFYDLFQHWYIQDYKALRKLSDLGISLKRHVFVDNCQCSEFLKYISQVLRYIFFRWTQCYFCYLQTILTFFLTEPCKTSTQIYLDTSA